MGVGIALMAGMGKHKARGILYVLAAHTSCQKPVIYQLEGGTE